MKKILSLLMLALVSIGTARAADEVVLYFTGTSANSITVNDFTLAITGNAEKKWSQGNGKISYSGKEYQTLKNSNGAQNTITCPEGRKATKVVFYVVTNADTAGKLSEFDGAECSDEVSSLKDYVKPTVIEKEIANKGSFTFTFSTKQVCFIAVVTLADSNEPQLAVSPKTLDLNLSPIVLTKSSTFTLTGANLTNGSYNLTLPNLAGLSVEPTSFTVADGTVNQEFTVTYSSNVDVTASTATITAQVGDLSAGVTVNYSAKTVPTTLQSISEATSWDFDTDVTYSGKVDYTMTDTEKEIVYADYDQLLYKATFNASALAFKGKYPFRNSNKRFAQEGTLKFNTTVPGTIVVKFSDTGSSASATAVKRYLIVNGEQTEYWSSRENNGDAPYAAQLDVTTGEIEVPAGDVTITGSSAIIVSKIVFTPKAEEPATELANIKALKEFTSDEIGEIKATLTLTNAKVNFVTSKETTEYDDDWNEVTVQKDYVLIEDASAGYMFEGSGLGSLVEEGDVLNGSLSVKLADVGFGIWQPTLSNGIEGVTATGGEVSPLVVTDENVADYAEDNDFRLAQFDDAVINVDGELSFTAAVLGDDPFSIMDTYKIIPETMADGTKGTLTGYVASLYGMTFFTPTAFVESASTLTVTVGTDGYATFCSDQALDFTEATSIKAYTATLSGTDITFTRIYNVPANTGVLLWAEGGASEEIAVVEGGGVTGIQNVLKGTLEAIPAGSLTGKYILAKNGENIGFYKAGATATLAAGKAYIEAPAGARIILPGGETTGINGVEAAEADAAVYNLQGQRIQKAQKGLNIKNGRKYIVR